MTEIEALTSRISILTRRLDELEERWRYALRHPELFLLLAATTWWAQRFGELH